MKAVLILCLVACSLSFQMRNSKKLAALSGASFGNLFAQIKEQIRAGGPLANIEGLLDMLEDQIRDEQSEHDAMLERNQASCKTEAEFRTGEIAEGKAALRRATNHFAACESSLNQAKVALEMTIQDIADSRAALAAATARREAKHELFMTRAQDHRNAMSVVKGALAILDDMVVDANLIQLSSHTMKMLKTGVKVGLSQHYAPVIALFAQMATSEVNMFLDAGAVNRVKSMLNQLFDNIEDSLTDYTNTENSEVENYQNLKAKLEQSIRELEENKVLLEDHIEEMNMCLLQESLLIQKSEEKISRNSNLLELSVAMCAAFEAEYAAATNARKEELELLKTVRKMVKRRLDGIGANVVARDDAFVNEEVDDYEEATFEMDGGNADDAMEGFGIDGF